MNFSVNDWTRNPVGRYEFVKPVTIATKEDDQPEAQEVFNFEIGIASGQPRVLGLTASAQITINDDDLLKLEGVAVSSTPANNSYYDLGETIRFSLTFSYNVTVTGTPQFAFSMGTETRHARYESGSGSAVLVFSYTVARGDDDHNGISWPTGQIALNGGSIKFRDGMPEQGVDAIRTHTAKPDQGAHKVDYAAPVSASASLFGNVLTLIFSEAMNRQAPANSAFRVSVNATANDVTSVSITGSNVLLTLTTEVLGETDVVTLTYIKPATTPLRDQVGREADGFQSQSVTVKGNERPTSENAVAQVIEDTPYTFPRSLFRYADRENDRFEAIKVETPPSSGRLWLDGSNVTTGGLVRVADLDSGKLRYHPQANISGNNVDRFTFRVVSDNQRQSAAAYTMTINIKSPVIVAPRFVEGARTTRQLAGDAKIGAAVGNPVRATHPNNRKITYSLKGDARSPFTVDAETGQVRLGQEITPVPGQEYMVTLTARVSAVAEASILLTIQAEEAPYHRYDRNRNGHIERNEALSAIQDYFRGKIGQALVLDVVRQHFEG